MKSGHLLILGMCLACINVIFLYHFWWAVPVFLWLIILLYRKFNFRLLSTCILIIVLSYFMYWQFGISRLDKQAIGDINSYLVIHPDNIDFKPDYGSGTARLTTGEKVRISFDKQSEIAKKCSQNSYPIFVQITGKLNHINEARNEYSFNADAYWRSRGIVHRLQITRAKVLGDAKPKNFVELIVWTIHSFHCRLVNWFEKLPKGLRDYGETLLLGYTRLEFYTENGGIQLLGLMHLFSISGFQVTIVYQIWRYLSQRLWIQREYSLVIVQFILIILWVFAGGVQSLIRPVFLGVSQAWRDLHWLNIDAKDAWGLALIGGVLIEPGVLHNLGGQLSYLLTFGLLWLQNRPSWYQSIWLSFFILPTLLWHTFSWHPVSLIANLIIVPIFVWFIMPVITLGVLATICHFIWLQTICEWIINSMQLCIKWGERMPGECLFGRPLMLFCIVLTLLPLIWLVSQKKYWLVILICCYSIAWLTPRMFSGGFIAFFDIGQGDTTILRPTHQQVTMVDVGGKFQFLQSNQKKQPITNYQVEELIHFLKGHAIDNIQQLILTHKDIDHIGNVSDFLEQIKVAKIYVPAGMERQAKFNKRITKYIHSGGKVCPVLAGMKITKDIQVCHPIQQGVGENDDSIAVYVNFKRVKLMMTGDLSKKGEKEILKHYNLPPVDILKLGHHGSKTSTDADFVSHLQPKFGIVSAGVNNRYGHPNKETLMTAKKYHMVIYNTAKQGMIKIKWGIFNCYRLFYVHKLKH